MFSIAVVFTLYKECGRYLYVFPYTVEISTKEPFLAPEQDRLLGEEEDSISLPLLLSPPPLSCVTA